MAVGTPVSEGSGYAHLSASGAAVTGRGAMVGIFVASCSASPTITVYDSTTGSGTLIVNTFTPAAGQFYPLPARFATGLYVAIGGTVDCTVFASPD